jgi:hypothetical protein
VKRLVVFDDEYVVVQGVRAMIKKLSLNFEVVGEAYDGVSALEVLEKYQTGCHHDRYTYARIQDWNSLRRQKRSYLMRFVS